MIMLLLMFIIMINADADADDEKMMHNDYYADDAAADVSAKRLIYKQRRSQLAGELPVSNNMITWYSYTIITATIWKILNLRYQ